MKKARLLFMGFFLVAMAVIVACGEEATSTPTATAAPTSTATPTATPVSTPTPTATPRAGGTLDVGQKELGPLVAVPANQDYLNSWFESIATHETLFMFDSEGVQQPMLAAEYTISPDGLTYTFGLQRGAKWHDQFGDWGEFNADDMLFTLQNTTREATSRSYSGDYRRDFLCDGCTLTKIDEYTVELKRPIPSFTIPWFNTTPLGGALGMHSKKHFDAVGESAANTQSVGTGSWMMVDVTNDVKREMEAVKEHWRKTPDWDKMIWWDIAEESTRLANFESGLLDTAVLNAESLKVLRDKGDPDIKFLRYAGPSIYFNIHGQLYYNDAPTHQPGGAMPLGSDLPKCEDLAWVSCDRDTSSAEWEKARKVREAMSISIDRQKLVNNLVFGDGLPLSVPFWPVGGAKTLQYGLDKLVYEYDPARAMQLLNEAGYGDGFDVELAVVQGSGFIEAGEAVATMWADAGIRTNITQPTYAARSPVIQARKSSFVTNEDWGSLIEPLWPYQLFFVSTSNNYGGFEHPDLDAWVNEAEETMDQDARYDISAEIARWIFNNVMTLPLYTQDIVYPLGPEIDSWVPHGGAKAGTIHWLSNWESVPHRQ